MEKEKVIEFFNAKAENWDQRNESNDGIIKIILDSTGLRSGDAVLDVACGTGVMIPYYLERKAGSVTGIDISPKMNEIARSKYKEALVKFILGDAEEHDFGRKFDRIIVYNAFPHFPDPKSLINCLSGLLNRGGTLTIAHDSSREEVDAHHKSHAAHVSTGLMEVDELAELFPKEMEITARISDESMYLITGKHN